MRISGLIVLSAAVQQVAATGWTNAKSFSCPSNTDNHCNTDQQRGFDWSGSAVETDFRKYGGFDFSGFTYVNSFHTKRDILAPRTFQDKCIKGSVTKDTSTAPKISCDSGKSFSINDLQVSTSKDTDLEFVYGYDNGDVCKHTTACSKSGTTITNSQCGGATSVTFKLPKHVEHTDCDIMIHRVSFDCGPPSSPPSPSSSSSVPFPIPSAPVAHPSGPLSIPSLSVTNSFPTRNVSVNTGSETVPATGTAPGNTPLTPPGSSTPASSPAVSSSLSSTSVSTLTSSPVASSPVMSPPVSPTPAPSSPTTYTRALSSSSSPPLASSLASSPGAPPRPSSPVVSPPVSSTTVSTSPDVAPPASSEASAPISSTPEGSSKPITLETTVSPPPGATRPVVTTEIVHTTLTTCPVTNTITSGSSTIVQSSFTVSTILSTVTSTICTKCAPPAASTPAASTGLTLPSSPPAPVQSESSTSPVAESSRPSPVPSAPSIPIPVTSATASVTRGTVPAPIPSLPATTQEVVTTEIVYTTLTTCPVTNIVTSGSTQTIQTSQTVSTVFSTVISTICTKCIAPPKTQPAPGVPVSVPSSLPSGPAPVPSVSVFQPSGSVAAPSVPASQPTNTTPTPSVPSSPPSGPAPAPSVLPKCMNTWITLTRCKNNADSDCYCKNSDFTKNVQDCVLSWSADSDVIQSALSYLAGICAPHVEANPGIVTNVPSTITLVPVPVATPASSAPVGSVVTAGVITPPPAPASIPATTISLVKTVTIPITYQSGPLAGQPVPSSSTTSIFSTQVTVPQVKFTTENVKAGATGTPEVDLAAGRPAPVQAAPIGVAGPTAGLSTFATGVLPSGYRPTAQPSVEPFPGAANRVRSGIIGAMIVGTAGLWLGL